jgi:hypothetical protein
MLSRRRLLRRSLYTAAGFTLKKSVPAIGQAMASPVQVHSEVKLTRYVDHLSLPPVIRSTGETGEIIDIEMRQFARRCIAIFPQQFFGDITGHGRGQRLKRKAVGISASTGPASSPLDIFFPSITLFMAQKQRFLQFAT